MRRATNMATEEKHGTPTKKIRQGIAAICDAIDKSKADDTLTAEKKKLKAYHLSQARDLLRDAKRHTTFAENLNGYFVDKGSIVKIYEDPLTQNHLEGEAKLIKRIVSNRDNDLMENWQVEFTSDGFKTERLVSLHPPIENGQ